MRLKALLASALLAVALMARGTGSAQDLVNLELELEGRNSVSEEQSALDDAKEKGVYRLRVRYVKVEGRWGDRVQLPLAPGDILTAERISASLNALRAAITTPAGPSVSLRSKGEVGVLYIDVKFDTSPAVDANGNARPAETAGVIFRPHYVHISLVEIGNNVLPIPRTGRPTFYDHAPRWIRALHPTAGASYDRAFGPAVSLGVATGLLDFLPEADDSQHLDLSLDGTKSLDKSFYRVTGGLRYSRRQNSGFWREFSLAADFDAAEEPLGGNDHTHYAGSATAGVKLKIAPNARLTLNAGYQRADDRLENSLGRIDAAANQETNRVLLDAIPPGVNGFLRAALWQENGWQTSDGASYQRIVGRVGYEKEISVAQNQTIGVELIAGAGHASGATPAYAQFFGGNPPGQFLYDGTDAATLRNLPDGPIIRSFGGNQARLSGPGGLTSGGSTFWHVNLNVTIPIRPWSMSLIPNELTDLNGPDGRPVSIKQMLKQQINVTGPSMLRAVLKNEGLSDKQAEEQARDVFREITPATRFIIEDANLYSLKPLLMFDAAGLSDGNGRSETWLGAGGGVQLTIVTAKLEAGYMHTLSGPRQGHDGNAFVRLVFQNLF